MRWAAMAFAWIAFIQLAGCALVPERVETDASSAIAASRDTRLGAFSALATPGQGLSGVRLLHDGDAAFEARMTLIERAEQSLDLQYYQFENDDSGRAVAGALIDAARRGVRVRILLDDWKTVGSNALLAALAETPRIELRLYNPFGESFRSSWGRQLGLLLRFSTLNARMHNKLFIADGAMAVVGGRNVGDAYFDRDPRSSFIDFDLLTMGAVVPDLAALFDAYWNSTMVYPVGAVLHPTAAAHARDRAVPSVAGRRLSSTGLTQALDRGAIAMHWGRATAFADEPGKPGGTSTVIGDEDRVANLREVVWQRMASTSLEYAIITPYLVPGLAGIEATRRNRARGVQITVLTNSLASTDEVAVHAAYQGYRSTLLSLGVQLSELSASRSASWHRDAVPGARTTLHAKGVVFDRSSVFVGSLNFDARSMSTNTEVGMLFDSPGLAEEILALVEGLRRRGGIYEARLGPAGQVGWHRQDGSVAHEEPETSALKRTVMRLIGPFIPESLL